MKHFHTITGLLLYLIPLASLGAFTIEYHRNKVQKNSRLHDSEPEENFALYDVLEEGFEICINNPVLAKFLYNATSTAKGIAHLQ